MTDTPKPTVVAFHLPQFHPTRINDANWGPGFTEWINVAKARPLFPDHKQPKLPGALSFYDLRCPEALHEQAELARLAGVDAFCFYYYRFGSQRVLERPLDNMLAHPEIDIDFLYCWANEPWTKAWDGRSDHVLLPQTYGEEAAEGLIDDLGRAMADPRYLRVNGRPVFIIYQVDHLPEAAKFVAKVYEGVTRKVGAAPLVGAVYSHGFKSDMLAFLDFVVQFPPHRMPRNQGFRVLLEGDKVGAYDLTRNDYFEPYESVAATALNHCDDVERMVLGVTPDWDNSARRTSGAHVLIGSTPESFRSWTQEAAFKTLTKFKAGGIPAPLLFVNAWNEWGEGAMLEPSHELGDAYLRALHDGLADGVELFEQQDEAES